MKQYEVMAKSEIGWISDYPIHWGISPLKRITVNCDNQRIPLSSEERGMRGGPFPYYGANGIIDYIDDYIFEGEYVLIGKDGAPFFMRNEDVALIARGKFWVNNHAHILRLISGNHMGFVKYWLNSVDYREYITGSTRDKLTQSDLSRILLLVPPIEEQTEIAKYLDHKTHLIDTLIEKKQKQIELLQEQRTAIINQAVTKGLNPNVKMKDSGIEWLGEVPEHWKVKRLKYLFHFISGGTPSTELPNYWDGEIPWVSPKDMKTGYLFDTIDHLNSSAIEDRKTSLIPSKSALIVVRSGILRHKIPVAIAMRELTLNQDLKGVVPKQSELDTEFFVLFVLGFQNELLINWRKQGATVESLELELIKNTRFSIPPAEEQQLIISFIKKKMADIDLLVEKNKTQIQKYQEYRTTLISNVVTGKIDVRDEVIP